MFKCLDNSYKDQNDNVLTRPAKSTILCTVRPCPGFMSFLAHSCPKLVAITFITTFFVFKKKKSRYLIIQY